MKKLNKFADYPGLREIGLDKNQAEKICKEVFDSKRLNFSFFKNIAGYSSAYSGFFSEKFNFYVFEKSVLYRTSPTILKQNPCYFL